MTVTDSTNSTHQHGDTHMPMNRSCALCSLLFVTAASWGCVQQTERFKAVEVGGTVVLKGTPLQDGTVTLESSQTGFGASAPLDGEGRFKIPHLPAGTYTVVVTPPQLPPPGDPIPPRDATKGPLRQIPERYMAPQTSRLSVTIPEGGVSDLNFALE